MRVLLTGAAGYTGRGLGNVVKAQHHVRGLDIRDADDAVDEMLIGNLADLDVCEKAVHGVEALVLCHMAPNPSGYRTPELAIDVNVKGTANLYHAAVEAGISRVVLISSTCVLSVQPGALATPGDGPYNYAYSMYAFTKILQEDIARYYYEKHGIHTAILRPAWIVYDEDFHTKYGDAMQQYDPGLIDPRDIGAAVLAALALPDLGLEAFNIGQEDSGLELTAAHERLGWHAEYRFTGLPRVTA